MIELPSSPAALAHATWEDLAPYYETLAGVALTHESVPAWLESWSRLEELISEASALASIAFTSDTNSPEKEAAHLRFAAEIAPQQDEQQVRLARILIESGFTNDDIDMVLRRFRTDDALFREENVPLFAKLEVIESGYDKIAGGMTVEWDGERKTVPQLQPFLKDPRRDVRERAFRSMASPYMAERDQLADLFDQAYDIRQRIARNAGFANFQEYVFQSKYRFDYTPADCARFHRAVEETVAPAVARTLAYRRERLGVETIRPWDLHVDLDGAAPLSPFNNVDSFVSGAQRIFDRVDSELGDNFRTMASEGLLDLESRPGKAPGGYCTTLHHRGKPFVFMNAVGVPDDVGTLIHEAGHCFHSFASHRLPLIWQRGTGMEAAELASMAMEFLAAPYLARPEGFYSPADARRARLEHLEDVLRSLAHIASVDAFQSWIYTSGEGGNRDARDRAWLEIRERFEPGVDWEGLRDERVARWYRQAHIFVVPFYYIEYGIAQLGALQIWRDSLNDHAAAVRRYKSALALGGTRPLPEIYGAAGATLAFDSATMGELVELVESQIDELRSESVHSPALPSGLSRGGAPIARS
jgi:oligoendopeptidase F